MRSMAKGPEQEDAFLHLPAAQEDRYEGLVGRGLLPYAEEGLCGAAGAERRLPEPALPAGIKAGKRWGAGSVPRPAGGQGRCGQAPRTVAAARDPAGTRGKAAAGPRGGPARPGPSGNGGQGGRLNGRLRGRSRVGRRAACCRTVTMPLGISSCSPPGAQKHASPAKPSPRKKRMRVLATAH